MRGLARREFLGVIATSLAGCGEAREDTGTYDAFHSPEDVTIAGYSGDAMEPFISRDGRYLLFNNSNDSKVNTDLHWAERVDDLTFTYRGEILGINTALLDAVPSLDREGMLYLVSTRSYERTWSTIYRAPFRNGVAGEAELVEGISRGKPGWVNFDAEISADGKTLYFVDGYFGSWGYPRSAKLAAAVCSGKGFHAMDDSARIFAHVNSSRLQYAPSVSASELELFLTRVKRIEPSAQPAIYRSARVAKDRAFSRPQRVAAIQGFAEAPAMAPDERSLYYHVRVDGKHRLRRVRRDSA